MALPESETGQHHFEIVNGQIEVAPYLLPPVPFRYPDLFAEIAELNEAIKEDVGPMYDRIIKLWFNSKLAPPPEYFKLIHQQFLRSEPKNLLPLKDAVGAEEEIVRQVMEIEGVNSYEAMELIQETFQDNYYLVGDLRNWQFIIGYDRSAPEDENDDGVSEVAILLFDFNQTLSDRFVKQLALAGIFTRTQLGFLDQEQREKIKKIRVPKRFTLTRGKFDFFVEQVEEIQIESTGKYSTLSHRKKHNQ